jgi:hypothetical protein
MAGWISLHRKILENPVLNRSRTYSNFEAWIWLLLKANHKDNKFMLGADLVKVKKGSLITSQKKLCRQFRWGNSKLRSFLKVLQKDKMIELKTNTQSTWITICNYDTYQDIQTANKSKTNRKQTANKLRTNTNNNVNKVNTVNKVNKVLTNKKYIDQYGLKMLNAFVMYWNEKSANGKKHRCEKEKAFEVPIRLEKWAKNDYDGYYKKHKEDLIRKQDEEYYNKAKASVSKEESLRQKKEIAKITKNMFRKV